MGAGLWSLRSSPKQGRVRASEASQAVDWLIEVSVEPLPEHLSHLVHAEELVPRQSGESEDQYFHRVSSQYRTFGYRHGELLVAKPEGFQSRVKPN